MKDFHIKECQQKKNSVIIVAAGSSSRMSGTDKLLHVIGNKPLIYYTIKTFEDIEKIDDIILVVPKEKLSIYEKICAKNGFGKVCALVAGGETRQQSVEKGVIAVAGSDTLLVHDGARPFVTAQLIEELLSQRENHACIMPAVMVKDTIKGADADGFVTETLDRSRLWLAQTPQVFDFSLYKKALDFAKLQNVEFTDDCQLLENFGERVKIVVGEHSNIKITTADDLMFANVYFSTERSDVFMRVGHGYDVHKFAENRELVLGGVKIEHCAGLLGHSDADVLTHAVIDSVLGALALGDIGTHFPDDDDKFLNADSITLLKKVANIMHERGYLINNLDVTVVAEQPKLGAHVFQMRENLASALSCEISCVNVKATTEEGLGFTGEKLGISAHAICMLKKHVKMEQ